MLAHDRILVFAPHADDEALGCGGFLQTERCKHSFKRLVLISDSTVNLHQGSGVTREVEGRVRADEFHDVARRIGASTASLGFSTRCIGMNMGKLVKDMEQQIWEFNPDCVLFPGKSFHQDHNAVYQGAFAAMRPGNCPSIRTALTYEVCNYLGTPPEDRFEANIYVPLSEREADLKLSLCACYKSQLLDTRAYQTLIRRGMQRRGMELEAHLATANLPDVPLMAEAFHLVRGVAGTL